MKTLIEHIATKPWLLVILAFFLLISVWVIFFALAARNQPERLPVGELSSGLRDQTTSGTS